MISIKKDKKVFGLVCTAVLCCLLFVLNLGQGYGGRFDRSNSLHYLYFHPQSGQLMGSCASEPEGSIRFWAIEDGRLNRAITTAKDSGTNYEAADHLAISHDGNFLAVAFFSHKVGLYSLKEQKWVWKIDPLKEPFFLLGIVFTSDDKKVIVVGLKNFYIFDAPTGGLLQKNKKPLNDYSLSNNIGKGVALSPNGRYLAVWQRDPGEGHGLLEHLFKNKSITVWDIEENKLVGSWKRTHMICSAVFSPDEKYLLLSPLDGSIRVWSVDEKKFIKEWNAHPYLSKSQYGKRTSFINSMTFSDNGEYLASFGDDPGPGVRIWNYATGELVHKFVDIAFNYNLCDINPMAFSPDGKLFAIEKIGRLCLYDTKTWEEKWCVLSWPEDNTLDY